MEARFKWKWKSALSSNIYEAFSFTKLQRKMLREQNSFVKSSGEEKRMIISHAGAMATRAVNFKLKSGENPCEADCATALQRKSVKHSSFFYRISSRMSLQSRVSERINLSSFNDLFDSEMLGIGVE